MAGVMYLAPAVFLADEVAHAAPIVDPHAPIQFQPTMTRTSAGVAAVNIATPNANGISVNSYQSFNIDSSGLVLNNSLVSGTPLLGGTLGANPNLAGRAATTIVNQVTSTGPASTLLGPLEVFGTPANVIISSPNGLSVNGLALTNIPNLVLTTGAVQFLTGIGGTVTSFANAGALAYSVSSGNITINGPAGVNGPGAGIAGTVGNIDVIGQTLNVNAPIQANQSVNLIAGNQFVTPTSTSAAGTTYAAASNGTTNTAAAIGNAGVAIDASQYGSVTSGQIFIVSTSAGMGVNTQGPLAATAGNVNVTSNGDITVGNTFANQNVNLTSSGTTNISGTGLANQNYTVAANGDINATGSVSAGQNVAMNAGGDLNAASVSANGSANLTAGQSMSVGSLSAQSLALAATNGNLTLNSAISAPGTIAASAGQNLTVNGAVQGGSTVALTAGQNVTVNGSVSAVGDATLTAQNGMLTTTGNVVTNGALSVSGQQGANLGGTVSSQGNATIRSTAGSVAIAGTLSSPGAITVSAGQDATLSGSVQSGQDTTITAARNVALNGGLQTSGAGNAAVSAGGNITGSGAVSAASNATLSAGSSIGLTGAIQAGSNLSATAAQNLLVAATTATGTETLTATNGSATLTGNAASGGDLSVTAGTDVNTLGSVQSLGNLALNAQNGSLTASAPIWAAGNATLNAGQSASVNGPASAVGNMTLAAQAGTLTTAGNLTTNGTISASGQQGVSLGGTVSSQGNATIGSSAGSVSVAGAVSSPGTITVTAGQGATLSGLVHSGGDTTVAAGGNVALNGGLEADGTGNATVSAGSNLTGSRALSVANNTNLSAGGDIGLTGAIQTGNTLAATAGNNLSVGATTAVGTETLTATNGSATFGNTLSGGDLSVTAGTDVNAQGSVQSLGNLAVNAQGGNFTASGPVSAAGSANLNAGQSLTLNGQTTVSQNATLTGTNITTQGLAVGGSLMATATNNLDTSAGQLNAPFSANAPALSVTGNATLSGANVTTANAYVGGTYSATGTTSLTTGGTAAYQGSAILAGGTVTNVGTQMAAGNLTVSGGTVTNQGALSSLTTFVVNAANLNNSGTIYGPTNTINVSGGTANSGGLLATNTLSLTTGTLNDTNGLTYAGDVNNPNSPTGNTSVTVTGGNGSFTNSNGQILGQNSVTLNLPNQAIDPSSSAFGTVNGGNAFNFSTQAINNSGTWTLPGTAVTVTASQGISNAGTITQGAGSLTLNGALTNSGSVTANDLTVNGSLANAAGATVQANDAFTLNGSGANAGTAEAVNSLNISGSSYDNSNGTTKAGNSSTAAGSGNLNINLSGDLTNAAGTLAATNNLAITANNVVNSASASATTSTTTTTVSNPTLLLETALGTDTTSSLGINRGAQGGGQGSATIIQVSSTQNATLTSLFDTTSDAQSGVTGNTLTFIQVPMQTGTDANGNTTTANEWVVLEPGMSTSGYPTMTVALPSVTETSTTVTASGAASIIAAGNNLSLTANTLNNQGGTVSAGNDATLNVQSLSNGGQSYQSTVTDAVSQSSYAAFMTTLSQLQNQGGVSVYGSDTGGTIGLDAQGCAAAGNCQQKAPTSFTFTNASTLPSVSSSVTIQGPSGQIVAGHNLSLSGGNLTNAGSLVAGNDVAITASSFTNQGTNTCTMTTVVGCASGYSGCVSGATTNPNSQSYSYQQTNATVTAGNDVVIAAGAVNNTYGNLVARRNVVIGGAGTSASDASTTPTALTQASSVTNTSGSIEAGNDADINASTLTNTIAAPVQIHQNYGSASPFTACGGNCEAYVDVQSASPATITANHNVNLTASTFNNTGSLVTALNTVSITATSSASSNNQYLYAYFAGGGVTGGNWGCAGAAALCGTLYGSAYSGGTQDPAGLPDAVGLPDFVPATIQAGNALFINSPTLTNTSNLVGQNVSLTGAQLVNGLTNPNVYTPPPAMSGQVISLGPPAVPASAATTVNSAGQLTNINGQPTTVSGSTGPPTGVPLGTTTVGRPVAPTISEAGAVNAGTASSPSATTVQTIAGQTQNVTYLVNSPASAITGDLSPTALLSALPASLQPNTTQFYYDPYTQAQQVEQAALEETGQSSFYSTTSATDSTSQASINNQDTQALYGAALQYAEQNNIALGTQLSQQQLALVNAPMLWYTEETVPEPGCSATGNASCPTVRALMPEVLLPQNFAQVNADGTISGANVSLNYNDSILNTGSISASQTLSIDTGSLTNEQRSTNVGSIYQTVNGDLYQTTGTEVQQGGFMSAANYDMNVQALNQIGGALQVTNADGSENTAATAQLLSNLKSQLGTSFTQSTVSNQLNTVDLDASSFGPMQIFAMVAAVVASIVTAGAGAALVGAVAGTLEASVANAAFSALVSSLATDAISGNFSLTGIVESMGVSALTAGLTNGITYSSDSGFGFTTTASPNSLAALAGVQPSTVSGAVPTASSTIAQLPTQALAIAGEATIQAGVQTAIEGGSFLTALEDSAVTDASAAGAYDIGTAAQDPNSIIAQDSIGYDLAHAALGCAAGAAEGTGCASGAIGGAVSAATANEIATAVTGGQGITDPSQLAAITAATMLLGGGAAALFGQSASAAALAAENETLNNTCATGHNCGTLASALADTGRAAWNTALGLVQSVPNLLNGALPGYADYAPFLQGAMLPYDDPDFGSLVSFTGALGVGALAGSSAAGTATSGAAAGEARASASSSIATAGDVDLANAYSTQVQGVATNTSSTARGGVDFYVNSQGTVLPATGYRYMDSQYAAQTQSSMSAPLSYFGFTDYSTGAAARNGFQIFYEPGNAASWSDASLKGQFDTLQLFGPDGFVNAKVPLANGGAGPRLEPYTNAYPQYGTGGQAQLVPAIPGTKVQLKNVTVLPSK
ncbi:beta strand repeat-containing protein [Trinickia violacea]|nr:filamentous hemagglutinin N-terminal domain-containing protein [Trinickia violacea]